MKPWSWFFSCLSSVLGGGGEYLSTSTAHRHGPQQGTPALIGKVDRDMGQGRLVSGGRMPRRGAEVRALLVGRRPALDRGWELSRLLTDPRSPKTVGLERQRLEGGDLALFVLTEKAHRKYF